MVDILVNLTLAQLVPFLSQMIPLQTSIGSFMIHLIPSSHLHIDIESCFTLQISRLEFHTEPL